MTVRIKTSEEAERLAEAWRKLLGQEIEIRTPLDSILGMTEEEKAHHTAWEQAHGVMVAGIVSEVRVEDFHQYPEPHHEVWVDVDWGMSILVTEESIWSPYVEARAPLESEWQKILPSGDLT
jgi:hypothetical protein